MRNHSPNDPEEPSPSSKSSKSCKREPFDKEQYVEVARIGEAPGSGSTTLRVAIYQYGDGAPKIKLQRITARREGEELKLDPKGMSADEAEAAGTLLSQAAKSLRKL